MVANVSASDWSGERGEAWRDSMTALEAMLAPINMPLIEALELNAPYRIADIGCGGGETSVDISRNAYLGSVVEGFDISPALIQAAKDKSVCGDVPIHFHIADAQEPPKAVAAFDRLTSRFGIMFFSDPEIAFSNLLNWLKPGGQFAFAVWGPPTGNPWMSGIRQVLGEHVVLPSPDPNAPGPFRYQDAEAFVALLIRSGFRDVQSSSWKEKLFVGGGLDANAATDFALSAFSIGQQLKSNDQTTIEAARADLMSFFSKHMADGLVCMDAHVHLVTGKRA
ncbi:MAG: class I SAM-dependent methyltransferase [Pseudomonadota bacterium]